MTIHKCPPRGKTGIDIQFSIKFYTGRCISKEIRWLGLAYDDLLNFPIDARRQAGFQLGKVQAGIQPDDWRPFDEVGSGTREIRIREAIVNARNVTL